MKRIIFTLIALISIGCPSSKNTETPAGAGNSAEANRAAASPSPSATAEGSKATDARATDARASGPKTVREFFDLLPQKYFVLEGCDEKTDKNCDRARREYLKNFLEIEDTNNGYLKAGCDGAQSCLEMAVFKRPDETYLVGLNTFAEGMIESRFLDYKNGLWTDVSADVAPEFSRKNVYEMPRRGTTVQVFAKKNIDQAGDVEFSEKGAKMYDLEWKDGKFVRK